MPLGAGVLNFIVLRPGATPAVQSVAPDDPLSLRAERKGGRIRFPLVSGVHHAWGD